MYAKVDYSRKCASAASAPQEYLPPQPVTSFSGVGWRAAAGCKTQKNACRFFEEY